MRRVDRVACVGQNAAEVQGERRGKCAMQTTHLYRDEVEIDAVKRAQLMLRSKETTTGR